MKEPKEQKYFMTPPLTMEKGMATGSFVTLWPAIKTIFSASSGKEYFSSKIEITCLNKGKGITFNRRQR